MSEGRFQAKTKITDGDATARAGQPWRVHYRHFDGLRHPRINLEPISVRPIHLSVTDQKFFSGFFYDNYPTFPLSTSQSSFDYLYIYLDYLYPSTLQTLLLKVHDPCLDCRQVDSLLFPLHVSLSSVNPYLSFTSHSVIVPTFPPSNFRPPPLFPPGSQPS